MDWSAFHAYLEDKLPRNPAVNEEETMDKCAGELTSVIQDAIAASAPKRRSRADPRPHLLASIQDEIRLWKRLRRQWKVTTDPIPKAEVNRLQRSVTYRLNEWRKNSGATRWNPLTVRTNRFGR
jgi:hypothetical protein